MNLSKLFVIALLAGTLGVIGCSDDENGGTAGIGGTGTGGSGGTATDPCTGGFCVDPSEPKTVCELTIEFCKSADCCEGVNPTDDQCDAFGTALCTLDFGGAGGAGGAGGVGGGDGTEEIWVCLPGHLENPGYVPRDILEQCEYSLDCDVGLICVCLPGAICDPDDPLKSGPTCQRLCDPTMLNECPVILEVQPDCTDLGEGRGFCDPTTVPLPR
jgi:hypothetical protein